MGLQRAATGDGPRLLRTPDRQQPNPKKGAKATKIPEPENFGKFRQKNFDTPLPVQRVADAPFSRAVGLTIGRGGHKMGRALAPPPQRTDPIEGAPPSRGGNRPEDADQGDDGDTNGGHKNGEKDSENHAAENHGKGTDTDEERLRTTQHDEQERGHEAQDVPSPPPVIRKSARLRDKEDSGANVGDAHHVADTAPSDRPQRSGAESVRCGGTPSDRPQKAAHPRKLRRRTKRPHTEKAAQTW